MGARERLNVGEISFKGISTRVGANTYRVLARDGSGRIVLAVTTLADPTAETGAGFSKGALIIKSDAADGTKAIYENQGTVSTASMNLMGVVSGTDIPSSAIVTTKIADGAVIVDKLGAAAVAKAKVKYIQATMAVASNTTSLSVSSASFTNGVIIGVNHAFTNFVGTRVLHKVSLTASTAKVSISGATTHTGGATYILTILRA